MKTIFICKDETEARQLLNAKKYYSCLWSLQEYLVSLDEIEEIPSQEELLEKFKEILEDYNINLYDIDE